MIGLKHHQAVPGTISKMLVVRSLWLGFILFTVGWITLPSHTAAADPAYLDVGQTVDGVYILDPATFATIPPDSTVEPNAEGEPDADNWQPITFETLDHGISGKHFLIRFAVGNTSKGSRTFVFAHEIAFLHRMDVRMVSSRGETRSVNLSNSLPFADRLVSFPGLAYRGTIEPGEIQNFTLRIGMDSTRRMSLGIKLWDNSSFETYEAVHQLKFSSISIIIVTMAVLWLIFAILMKQKSLAYYSGYLFFLGLSMFLFYGFGYQFLFPEHPWIQDLGFQGPILAAMACALMFSTYYLSMNLHMPRLHRINTFVAAIIAIGAVFAIFGGSRQIIVPLVMASLFVPLWLWICSLIVICRDRTLNVLLFCAAWGTMGLTAAVLASHITFSFLPGDWTTSSNYDAITVASLVEVLILTVSVALSIRMLQRERDSANAAATADPLTGLLNRRGFQQTADLLLETSAHGRWCLALLDLDQFKVINDTFGHGAGDRVLVDFADMLRDGLAERDMACRMGGEEFAILFDAQSPEDALARCERLRSRFSHTPTLVDGQEIPHKVSIGLATHDRRVTERMSLERMLRRADEALYRAKRAGRNRVIVCEEDQMPETDIVLELRLGGKSR